tara:strand:+ start:5574 stop:7673 length:2100 start_codon:yes stop_codon:yes gene_type:complete
VELKPIEASEIEDIAREAILDSIDFVESEVAEDRIKAQRYYNGEVDIGEEEGRSTVVSTKIRDAIRAIKPGLLRVFLSTDRPVEFVPTGPEDIKFAEQATKYIQYKFQELNGYEILNEAFHDALLKKTGIVKVYWDNYMESETYTFNNLNDMEFSTIVNEQNIEVIEHTTKISVELDEFGAEVEMPRHDLKVSKISDMGKLCVESVPPEEFFIDRNATSIQSSYVCGQRTEVRVSDLVEMGYEFDEVSELSGLGHSDTFSDVERYERRGYEEDYQTENPLDPSMRIVALTELYMKIDVNGTGVAEMQKIVLGGNDYKLLGYEPWGDQPFAAFEIDPEPHTFYGRSIADLLFEDQDASTMMLRGVLDNVALTNHPRTEVIDGAVNMDDMLNNEIGGIVRVRQGGAIVPLTVPFVAAQTLSAIEYYDGTIEQKVGISRASMGLNPDALQATTATAVNATMQGAAGQTEVMARNLAEGGVRQMFKLMLKLVIENCDEEQIMRISGEAYEPVDPRSWNKKMDTSVNVGLGTGREDQRNAALSQALQMQMQIFQSYGPSNGLVSMSQIRNTLADMLALNGVKNADRYFAPMSAEQEQQLLAQQQQQQQGQQPPMDQATAYLQAEQVKAEAKAKTDMAKLQIDAQKAIAADDRERDKMDQDLLISAAEILGKYGTAVDVAQIKKRQDAPRYPAETPVQAVTGGRF